MPVSKLIMVVENKSIPEFEFPVRAGHPLQPMQLAPGDVDHIQLLYR